jgi:hypothetical protein
MRRYLLSVLFFRAAPAILLCSALLIAVVDLVRLWLA